MTATAYISRLAVSTALIALAGVLLRAGLGGQWFSFYGWASLALVASIAFGSIVFRRYRTLGIRTWPAVLLFLSIALAAAVQAGFWADFFNLGSQGLLLAQARTIVMPIIEPALTPAFILAAMTTAWILVRGAVMRSSANS